MSHNKNGVVNCTYGLVSKDLHKMIEFHPQYGPFTRLESTGNIIDNYLNNKCTDRSNWSQSNFENSGIKQYLQSGDLEVVVKIIKDLYDI